jgi:hypothetical protein
MATKKKAAILRWNPKWIKDPPPPFFKTLDRAAIKQIAQAKINFVNQVKAILKQAQ